MSSEALLPPAIFLMGPTASGKTGIAVELAQRLPVELISVDSALVYRGMDIGTAKPDQATLAKAPHHLIDIIEPTESYSAAQFRNDALRLMADIKNRNKTPLLVGGTMMYFNVLQHGLNNLPEAEPALRRQLVEQAQKSGWPAMHAELARVDSVTANRLKPNDAQRIERALEIWHLTGQPMSSLLNGRDAGALPYRLLKLALLPSDRAVLHQRIAQRFDQMLQGGLIEEVRALQSKYLELHPAMPSMRCVGYRQTLDYLQGAYHMQTLREKGIAATRQLAKRQMTWLRGMEDTLVIDCLDPQLLNSIIIQIEQFIQP